MSDRKSEIEIGFLEREAEKFLYRADQKYQQYFENDRNENLEMKNCAFKELFNLNHQIIKLLQSSEDRVEIEHGKAERNRKILQELDSIFREEGRKNMLQEIKTLNQKLL